MNVTDDVIRDLLPIYLAGEASAATRSLVEGYLAEHPEMAAEARRGEWSLPPVARAGATEAELHTLRRTKRLLAIRSWVLGWAIAFTALPLSFSFGTDTGLHWFFWPRHAVPATASLALGIAGWIAWFALSRRLRPRGF